MSDDSIEDFLGQASALASLAAQLGAVVDSTQERDVSDPTGQISLTLRGSRISGLRLGTRWREEIGAEMLGPSILLIASVSALDSMNQVMASPPQSPQVQLHPEWRQPKLTPSVRSKVAGEINTINRELDDVLTRMEQGQNVEAEVPASSEYQSRSGNCTVVVRQGQVVNIVYEPKWLGGAAMTTIVESTLEALELAYEGIDTNPPPPPPRTPLQEHVAALTAEIDDFRS